MAVNLSVFIEINGKNVFVGNINETLSREPDNLPEAEFTYDKAYMENPESRPISISLPFKSEPFGKEATRCFFEGLLPEGFIKKCIADGIHADEHDYLTILSELGNECLGAIRIIDETKSDIIAYYRKLTKKELREFANEGASESAQLVTKSHLSLTGASGKAGLYYNEAKDKWYLPIGDAPSTYIVKQSHVRLSQIVANEQLCLLTAKNLGIDVPESFIVNLGNSDDENILFATKRYDRIISEDAEKISGMSIPYRLHQEDFAQALGIDAKDKYEKNNQEYLKLMFDIIRNYSSNPVEDQLRLWDICIFNYLIGNTDNHIKNLSLLYSEDLKSVRLAPAYDIVSTLIYKSSTDYMAISIGGLYKIDDIDRNAFEREAKHVGIGTGLAMKHFDKMMSEFKAALKKSEAALTDAGFTAVSDISKKILTNFKKRG